jgi:ferric-dicitrate binding protein FerR (iron transport regulator)
VRVKGAEVEVLGTLFTIMAYEDEPENRIAVVNGMVKVTTDGGSKEVKAGEEAEVIYALPAGIPGVRPIEYPQDILASKNGIYRFRGKELGVVMREVARAYDVNVEVQPSVANQRIDGSLDLNKSLEVTLRQLKSLTEPFQIYFDHKGKTIIASTI